MLPRVFQPHRPHSIKSIYLLSRPNLISRQLNLPSNLHSLKIDPDLATMHAKATLSSATLAETDTYEFVEGNVYFPPSSIKSKDEIFTPSDHTTWCPWKGTASYVSSIF